MNLADQPAFPRDGYRNADGGISDDAFGMTYRQWLVGMALQGLLANPDTLRNFSPGTTDEIRYGHLACDLADEAIRAQEKS